mmetsp:Transcript_245/g.335  ORF Transcript_245/g.335 Transcript_245/m.335 type:complete len:388 (-) Transcript_245:231-1394(-)|eukprot:CAMPEP_0172496270 /NCGR_PEP_ID=MMETSP1066-20121228/84396_1 /TAXON_ID=671091 /ORGANISM="Coscinodiscus wailesii, Strain CCMP2513" /LENGTH=387 /DNA_ID=CAMNT_0013268475 /DNA_START=159 /DNA_END=1322 /DNA_ORIENTATION=+
MEELAQLTNASATFDEIASAGPPADPLAFPDAIVFRAVRVNATIVHPSSGEQNNVSNVVFRSSSSGGYPDRGYWIGRKLKKAIYGCVRSCTILRLREGGGSPIWEPTPQRAAVKIMDWNAIRNLRGRHAEDPVKEVAAMQYISSDGEHPNVMQALDVLADEQYLYCFMPLCSSGELFGFVRRNGRFTEPEARYWFKQILDGLSHLQKRGVCHRDMSLENILVNENTNCLIIDLGMCLRVPFSGDDGEVVDVSEGTMRRLISPQGPCGKPNYISPEVLRNNEPFDGFATDLWAAGIILFIMLVGIPPFEWANEEDPRFVMISRGGLMRMLTQWNRVISEDAVDLLQGIIKRDPRDRLTIMEVMDHPWIVCDDIQAPAPRATEGWRQTG